MDKSFLEKEYVLNKKSISDLSLETGKSKSTVRYWLNKHGLLRSRKEGFDLSRHKLGKHAIGVRRVFTQEWKDNISKGAKKRWEGNSKGVSLKPNGYYEYTTGNNKGRGVHRVLMEEKLGIKLNKTEHVHHINGDKKDNRLENLEVLSIEEHMKHHGIENSKNRNRNNSGQFK
jgi:DNA-binding transcriptional ArsR family regulator